MKAKKRITTLLALLCVCFVGSAVTACMRPGATPNQSESSSQSVSSSQIESSVEDSGSEVTSESSIEDSESEVTSEGLIEDSESESTSESEQHTHLYISTVTEASCEKGGYTTYTCDCGDTYVADYVDKLEHTPILDVAVAATCTQTGLTVGYHCESCQKVIIAQEVIPASGHKYTEWYESKPATETEAGEKRRDCENCEYFETSPTAVLGHSHDRYEQITIEGKEATCTETGLTEGKKCGGCGEILIAQEVIKANGHTEVTDKGVEATCTETGLTEGKHCSVCNEVLVAQEVVPALGHTGKDMGESWEPTCEEPGYRPKGVCTVCGEVLRESKIIPAKGHTGGEVVREYIQEPTCTESGTYINKQYCLECNEQLIYPIGEIIVVPALGHTEVTDKGVEATCVETGLTEGKHCGVCQEILIKQEVVPATGEHIWEDKACTVCGEKQYSEGLKYALNYDGVSYTVSGIGSCTDTEVVIPASYKGLPVTTIGSYAFSSCTSLTSVVIPDGVTSIGYGVFQYCYSLTSVVISDSVTSIGDYVFKNCSGLTSVVIPDSVTSIGEGAFLYCSSLTCITVHEDNTDYKDIDGNLYTKDGTTLIQYAIGKTDASFAIPDNVTNIGLAAFGACHSLTSVVIPDSVTSIGSSAFIGCSGLTSVVIPDSVTSIGYNAFYYCSSLTSVYYKGSASEWDKISIDVSGNSYLTNATRYYYRESQPTTSGNYWHYDENGEIVIWEPYIASAGLKYALNDDGVSYTVSGIGSCTDTELVIPASYKGLPVTSIGSSAFYDCDSLTSVVIGDSVTSIGSSAFQYCDSLMSVVIPDSVTSIGDGAFSAGTNLLNITVSKNNTAYQSIDGNLYSKDGKSLIQYAIGKTANSFTIPYGVTSIRYGVFAYCSSLRSIEIPYGVTSIGYGAFAYCSSLRSIEIPYGVTSIRYGVFAYCSGLTSVVIPDSVTSIGEGAFNACSSLTSIVIPDSVTSIGNYAFWSCDSLTSIEIPDSVTSIGYGAFSNCSSLTSVVIGDSVTSIGNYAFSNCSSLTSVVIGDSVTRIDYSAFRDCSRLTSVYYKGSSSEWYGISIDSYNTPLTSARRYYYSESQPTVSGNYWHYDENGEILIWEPYIGLEYTLNGDGVSYTVSGIGSCTDTELVIPSFYEGLPVTSIGDSAFYDCDSLKSVVIPDSVTSIGINAFEGCETLMSVYYTGDIKSWCNISFAYPSVEGGPTSTANPLYYAKNFYINGELVTDLVIPDTVTKIKDYAFFHFQGLTSVVIPDSVTLIEYAAFTACDNLTSMVIGNNVTKIDYYAFASCMGLKEIYYEGMENEWAEISIDFYSDYTLKEVTRYYYSETQPTEEGNYWHYEENGEVAVW